MNIRHSILTLLFVSPAAFSNVLIVHDQEIEALNPQQEWALLLEELDKNQDTFISLDEFIGSDFDAYDDATKLISKNVLQEDFKAFDKNKDGLIEQLEYTAIAHEPISSETLWSSFHGVYDLNKDGKISYEEFNTIEQALARSAVRKSFLMYDKNNDKFMTKDEYLKAERDLMSSELFIMP